MARRYFLDTLPSPGTTRLEGALAHHLANVLRSNPGDVVVLADGLGNQCPATVQRVRDGMVNAMVAEATYTERPVRSIHLAFAPPRSSRADWVFEHATEVGVAVFWPLLTAHSRSRQLRTDRWHKIIRAAAGQCDRAWLPEIREPRSLKDFLAEEALPKTRYIATAGGPDLPATANDEALLLVGPEGGFRPQEQEQAEAAGFQPCGLGPHVLRTETAALVGAAMLRGNAS